MSTQARGKGSSVILAESDRFRPRSASASAEERRDRAAGQALKAQVLPRALAAMLLVLGQLALLGRVASGPGVTHAGAGLLGLLGLYMIVVLAMGTWAKRRRRASSLLVTAALFIDLLFVYALTVIATTPDHYERALLGTIVVVHVASFCFGRRQARRVVSAGLLGYPLLIGSAVVRGLPIGVADELWTLAICSAGLVFIVLQADDVRRRLREIVELFEQAEQGDFTREYDATADQRVDAITRVGVAYNGVRAQLSSMVMTDSLTGCLNRRGFDQALTREVARAARGGSELALLAIDLDHFKAVNDTYGHPSGDVVLRCIGALLMKSGRAGDVVARVGGEEFTILLADTGERGAERFANRLRERISDVRCEIGEGVAPVTVTASIGVAIAAPSPGAAQHDAELLWSRADDALYQAKRANRDCVRVWADGTRLAGNASA